MSRQQSTFTDTNCQQPKAIFLLSTDSLNVIYGSQERCELERLADFYAPPQTRETVAADPSVLAEAEVIFAGWGTPRLDKALLDAAPNLRAVFYGGGSLRPIITDEFWRRSIAITTAAAANAVPVAEYTAAAVVLSLKHFWRFAALTRLGEGWGEGSRPVPGGFRSTVGFISLGMIARRAIELLNGYDINQIVYSNSLSEDEARHMNVERVSLDDLFKRSDVVSLHTPSVPGTRGMITGRHFTLMKHGATFINTARGAVVNEGEMIDVLRQRQDLTAVLDVTDPEPPRLDSPLLTLRNVVLTPHIAGSTGPECARLGHYMLEEFLRYLAGKPLRWQVTESTAAKMA